MKIDTRELGPGLALVVLDGRLDIAGAADIDAAFRAVCDRGGVLLVDLAATPFMASIGIRLLLAGAKALNRKGGAMRLFGCDPQVEKVLRATGVDQLVTLHATREDAVAGLPGPVPG